MLAFTLRTLSTVGTLLGALSFYLAIEKLPLWASLVLVAIIITSLTATIIDLIQISNNLPYTYEPNSKEIIDYMHKWLNSGGRSAIFSRDMSWATPTSEVGKLLTEKAKRRELLIFVSHMTDAVTKLHKLGAEVHMFPNDFIPKSRFTIIDFEKHGARIAVGVVEGKWHVIRESSLADLPLSPVLEDLVKLAKATGTRAE